MAFTKKRRSGDWLKGMYVGLYCYCISGGERWCPIICRKRAISTYFYRFFEGRSIPDPRRALQTGCRLPDASGRLLNLHEQPGNRLPS